jgi:hypothetical protein
MKLEHRVSESLEKAPDLTILTLNQHDSKDRFFLFVSLRRFRFWRVYPGVTNSSTGTRCGSRARREELRRLHAQSLTFHANAFARAAQGILCGVSPDGHQIGFLDPETRMSYTLCELTIIGQE